MALEQIKKRNIALAILFLNGLLLVPFTRFATEDARTLILILSTAITVTAAYFIFRYSSRQRKFMLLLIPIVVLLLALFTLLWEYIRTWAF